MEVGDAADNLWKIKVSQISCDDPNVSNQEGCFQYYEGESGTIESYGFQSNLMIASQNYAVCIRPEEGMCCIEYTPLTWDVQRGTYDNLNANVLKNVQATTCVAAADTGLDTNCAGAFQCYTNYVIIPYVKSDQQIYATMKMVAITTPNGFDRFCGTSLTPQGWVTAATQTSAPVISCQKPFRLMHVSGVHATSGSAQMANSHFSTDNTGGGAAVASGTAGNSAAGAAGVTIPRGFQLQYRQLPGNC